VSRRLERLALRLLLWLVQAKPAPASCRRHADCSAADLEQRECGYRAHHCYSEGCHCVEVEGALGREP
jgi:hypothetical protein